MKNWKYGANPKKIKYARRKAQPGYRNAQAEGRIVHVGHKDKPNNAPLRMYASYSARQPESTPLPQEGAANHSPEEAEAEKSDTPR